MHNILKTFAAAMLMFLTAVSANAIPAYPGQMRALQADGSAIYIQKLGDEYCHVVVTSDGYPLLFNEATQNYEYAFLQQGQLSPSGIVAAQPQQRSEKARRFLATVDKSQVAGLLSAGRAAALSAARRQVSAVSPAKTVRISDVPTTGRHDVLVILVQFADVAFSTISDPAAYYDRFFHEEGFSENGAKGSVYDFYRYGSNEKYDPQFKVYGPVTLQGNASDYAGASGSAMTYKLIQQAVPMVDSLYNVDFTQFDTDGDGKVDNVYCIYAGYGQADSYHTDVIWPHSGNLITSRADNSFQVDGVTIDRYTVSQEINGQSNKTVGIGTFCHEFGHVLGLADHYNTANSSATNQPGYWDLMAAGSYNDDQNCPPTFSAFERYSLGWDTPVALGSTTDTLIRMSPYEDTGLAYRISIAGKPSEYYLIENRQQKSWDTYLPGHGMLVWHIDEDQSVWDTNTANADASHQRVDIVEAGRTPSYSGNSDDAFPGTRNVTAYNFTAWNGRSVFGFAWLTEDSLGQTAFVLTNTDYRLPAPEVEVSDIMGTTARVSWTASVLAEGYKAYVTRNGVAVDSLVTDAAGFLDVKGLQPETDYEARVISTLATLRSDTVVVPFTTLPLQIEERRPEGLSASGYNGTDFTASWQPVPEADQYRIALLERTHNGTATYGSGFDNYTRTDPGFPAGWYITDHSSAYTRYYGEASPSIRLRNDSARLVCCVPGAKVKSVRFWHRASVAGLCLSVDKYVDGEWSQAWSYRADEPQSLIESVEVGEADSVRFVLTRDTAQTTSGYQFLDDVWLTYLYDQYATLQNFNAVGTAATSCTYRVSGLDPQKDYAFTVQAMEGDRLSLVSDTFNVETATGLSRLIVDRNAQFGQSVAVYDLQGRLVGVLPEDSRLEAVLPRGVYVVRGKKVVVK